MHPYPCFSEPCKYYTGVEYRRGAHVSGWVSNCSSLDHNSRVITTDALLNAFHFFSQSSELIFTFALRNFFKFWKLEFNLVECSAKSIKYLEMYRLDVAPYSRITLCHFAVTRSRCERSYGCLTFTYELASKRSVYQTSGYICVSTRNI